MNRRGAVDPRVVVQPRSLRCLRLMFAGAGGGAAIVLAVAATALSEFVLGSDSRPLETNSSQRISDRRDLGPLPASQRAAAILVQSCHKAAEASVSVTSGLSPLRGAVRNSHDNLQDSE